MTSIRELIEAQKRQVESPSTLIAEVALGGELVQVRLTKMESWAWLNLSAQHPIRPGSSLDAVHGFNMHAVVRDYPEREQVLSEDESATLDDETWADMMSVLSAADIDTIATGIWALNVLEGRQAVKAAKKASAGERSMRPASPAN